MTKVTAKHTQELSIPRYSVAPAIWLPERVYVYRNLKYKGEVVWSVRDASTGRVVMHLDEILLQSASFSVGKAGRKRVLREKRKNVHAGIVGRPVDWVKGMEYANMREATYNPYKYDTFVDRQTKEPVHTASAVLIDSDGVRYW